MFKESNLSIVNLTKMKIPLALPAGRQAVLQLKNEILGKGYSLSVAYVEPATSKTINHKYRQKNKPTNVLSFELSAKSGELVLCPDVIRKETGKFEMSFRELFIFLIIHGMLHLRGLDHGEEMENLEKKYLSRTKFLK